MTDYGFKALNTIKGYPQRAMCAAVLGSLFSSDVYSKYDVPKMLRDLRAQWHARLNALREEGWEKLQDAKALQFMRNCPPFGIETKESSIPCHYWRFCPFCWARTVVQALYNGLKDVCLPEGQNERGAKRTDIWIIEFDRRELHPRETGKVEKLVSRLATERRSEIDQVPHLAAFVRHAIYPSANKVCFSRRGLLVTEQKSWPTGIDGVDVRIHKVVSRKLLCEVVGRVGRYPSALLRCPAKDLLKIIGETENVRLFSRFGRLRQSHIY